MNRHTPRRLAFCALDFEVRVTRLPKFPSPAGVAADLAIQAVEHADEGSSYQCVRNNRRGNHIDSLGFPAVGITQLYMIA